MIKGLKLIKFVLLSVTLSLLCALIFAFFTVPDELYAVSDEYLNVKDYYSITYCEQALQTKSLSKSVQDGQYKVKVKLFNAIPVKDSSLTVSRRKYVVPLGEIFGLRFFTQGVLIVGTGTVKTESEEISPAENAGLLKGDIITQINGINVNGSESVYKAFSESSGKSVRIAFERDGNKHETWLTPAFSASEGKYKAGLWIRDSAAGIGTMTFYDPANGAFASLGHGVCDVDTGEILPLSKGDAVAATITGCYKGKQGQAGELCGVFTNESMGLISVNCTGGVYGVLYKAKQNNNVLPVATGKEIKEGKAHIISTVDEKGPVYYEIEILKVSPEEENKNMVIQVTDNRLIEKTGGIVQGMSGSPIIQNGRLVGAVTHVLIGDPTKGYGIFAENMLKITEDISQQSLDAAS